MAPVVGEILLVGFFGWDRPELFSNLDVRIERWMRSPIFELQALNLEDLESADGKNAACTPELGFTHRPVQILAEARQFSKRILFISTGSSSTFLHIILGLECCCWQAIFKKPNVDPND